MAHRYGLPAAVVRAADGSPSSFIWHDATYDIAEVVARWHLADRWWEARTPYATRGFTNRQNYRMRRPDDAKRDLIAMLSQAQFGIDPIVAYNAAEHDLSITRGRARSRLEVTRITASTGRGEASAAGRTSGEVSPQVGQWLHCAAKSAAKETGIVGMRRANSGARCA